MASYDYKKSKGNILEILDNKTEIKDMDYVPSDSNFNYENGIRCPVASIFIDLRHSSELFKNNPKDRVARIIRSFVSEIVDILQSGSGVREVGIRGDCVYGIYSASTQDELKTVFGCASLSNTYMEMLNAFLKQKSWPSITAGIGLGFDPNELVIKAGKKYSGLSDFIWIGDAVIDASNCCDMAWKVVNSPIVLSQKFFDKIKNLNANQEEKYCDLIERFYHNGYFYKCNITRTSFEEWINNGMDEE